MGNLRQKYTDEEWEELEREIARKKEEELLTKYKIDAEN